MTRVSIVYASTSGHTEFVVEQLATLLPSLSPGVSVTVTRAELATPEALMTGDVLVLASGTWNTGGVEGQLNPHMHALLRDRAKDVGLGGRPCAVIGLGDHRYRYTVYAAVHLQQYVESHGGTLLLPPLKIVDEPYHQVEDVKAWGRQLAQKFASSSVA